MSRAIATIVACGCLTACAENGRPPETAAAPPPSPQAQPALQPLPPARGGEPMDAPPTATSPPTEPSPVPPAATSPLPTTPPAQDPRSADRDDRAIEQIRAALRQDNTLSLMAKNVVIVSNDGRVTLRGRVLTARERMVVVTTAQKVVGEDRVDDQLEIAK